MRAVLWALVISAALNLLAGWAWLHQRDRAAVAVAALDGAQAAGEACTEAVNGLAKLATDRAAAAKTERAAARKAAGRLQQRADRTLATAPAVPGDMCASMQSLGDDWLQSRAKP